MTTDGAVYAKKSAKKKKEDKKKKQDQEVMNREKAKAKKQCAEIEDEKLLHNCMFYNISPVCFIEAFGNQGLELGQVYDGQIEKDFLICWHRNNSIMQKKIIAADEELKKKEASELYER